VTNLITTRALLSPVFLHNCFVFHESGSDNPFQRHIHWNFFAGRYGLQPPIGFRPSSTGNHTPTPKNLTAERNKHDVDQKTHGGYIITWIFEDAGSRYLGFD